MNRYVVKNIPRPEMSITEQLARLGTATVYEAQGKTGLMSDRLKPIDKEFSISGPAVTVICQPGDNLMVHASVEVCKPGDVVVITTLRGPSKNAMIGDLLVSSFIEKGVKAIIIDSGVRDSKSLRKLGLPVWSSSINCAGPSKLNSGWVNAPAVCGDTVVEPGDLIVADDDGVVVIKRVDIESTLERSLIRERKEEETLKKIKNGELGLDFYGLRKTIDDLGIHYYENIEDVESR